MAGSTLRTTALRKTTWWLRIVAAFYSLLVAMNAVFIAGGEDQAVWRDTIPRPVDANGVGAFIDAWVTFMLALAALAVVLWYASSRPAKSRMVILTVVAGELSYGVLGDLWLIARGYSVGGYVAFIAVHLLIAGTGIALLRGELARKDDILTEALPATPASAPSPQGQAPHPVRPAAG